MTALRVLIVTGSRSGIPDGVSWGIERLEQLEREIANADLVLHGDADGVDRQAARLATQLNVHSMGIAALWRKRGKKAGPERNTKLAEVAGLLQQGGADVHYAALPDSRSSGTWDAVNKLKAHGIRGKVY
jgi:hypothetical protein